MQFYSIHGEMDDLVVQLDELTQMLAKEQMVARTLSAEVAFHSSKKLFVLFHIAYLAVT